MNVRINRLSFLTLLLSFIIVTISFAGTIQLPQTGQTLCYESAGDAIACKDTGQDGEIQAGVPWPDPRFTNTDGSLPINGNIIFDNLTGLEWANDGGSPTYTGNVSTCTGGDMSWYDAHDYVACLNTNNYLGHNDWRVPNIIELESLINVQQSDTSAWLNTQGFSNVVSYYYWSSSTLASNTDYAWNVNMENGNVYDFDIALFYPCCKDYNGYYVWPVRSGECVSGNSAICLPRTGQTISYYAAGDDGAMEKGVAWPLPRFKDNNNEMVTDNLTGLIWTKNAKTPGPAACNPGYKKKWQEAFNYIGCLNANNYLGYKDWRLPNRKELVSLTDYSRYSPSIPAGNPFTNVQSNGYWSSSTDVDFTGYAWVVGDGYVSSVTKGSWSNYNVWPVRGGQVEGAINYYCDDDSDDYISSIVSYTCKGNGCIRVGCQETPGYDCNDNNASINPGVSDTNCNSIDENCSGIADDGYITTPSTCGAGECASTGQLICQNGTPVDTCIQGTPSAEICSDGKDNDCDGKIDANDDPDCIQVCLAANKITYYRDADGDGYGNKRKSLKDCTQPTNYVTNKADCDDNDPNEHPDQVWYKDKDGYSDGISKTSCKRSKGYKLPSELIAISGDCADKKKAINPGATEGPTGVPTCTDKKDNDCDGLIDALDSDCL